MALGLEKGNYRFSPSDDFEDRLVVGLVPTENPFFVRLINLTPELIKKHGERRGDFWEVVVTERGGSFKVGQDTFPEILDIRELSARAA